MADDGRPKKDAKSQRLTFEDARKNLEKLRQWLDKLFDEKRPLRRDERREFIETVDRSLMGLARSVKIGYGPHGIILRSSELRGGTESKNIEDFLRHMAYFDAKVSTDDEGNDNGIEEQWGLAREKLLIASSVVLEAATRLSAERSAPKKEDEEI